MSIRLRCPDPECNKLLNVPDKLAGKKCRCPGCKSEIRVPAPEERPDEIVDDGPAEMPSRIEKAKAPPAKPRRRSREKVEEDEDDEGDAQPRKMSDSFTILNLAQFIMGFVCLIVLAGMPLLSWITLTGELDLKGKKSTGTMTISGLGYGAGSLPSLKEGKMLTKEGNLPASGCPEGLALMIVVLVLTLPALLFYAVGFLLAKLDLLGRGACQLLVAGATLFTVMESVLFLIWQLAWVWKAVSLADVIRKGSDRPQGGLVTTIVTISTMPGLGLLIGIGLAVVAAGVFSNLAMRLTRPLWCRLVELGALVLGGLLSLVVRPWDAKALWEAIQML